MGFSALSLVMIDNLCISNTLYFQFCLIYSMFRDRYGHEVFQPTFPVILIWLGSFEK